MAGVTGAPGTSGICVRAVVSAAIWWLQLEAELLAENGQACPFAGYSQRRHPRSRHEEVGSQQDQHKAVHPEHHRRTEHGHQPS